MSHSLHCFEIMLLPFVLMPPPYSEYQMFFRKMLVKFWRIVLFIHEPSHFNFILSGKTCQKTQYLNNGLPRYLHSSISRNAIWRHTRVENTYRRSAQRTSFATHRKRTTATTLFVFFGTQKEEVELLRLPDFQTQALQKHFADPLLLLCYVIARLLHE